MLQHRTASGVVFHISEILQASHSKSRSLIGNLAAFFNKKLDKKPIKH